jgi:parvulin-like peptidyl-prolyl isomerase
VLRGGQERLRQNLVLIGVGLVIVAAVVIAIFGYYQTEIATKHKTVLQVGETGYSLGHFERRLRFLLETSPALQETPGVGLSVLYSILEREGVLLEGAPRLGFEAGEEEVDAEIRRRLGLPEGGDERTFATRYGETVSSSGLHTDEYRRWVRASALEELLRDKFRGEVPPADTQVRARLIRLLTEEEAREVIGRLEAGEEFAALAGELSLDETTREQGGESDWLLRGDMQESVDEFLFTAEVGVRSEPLPIPNGYFVAEVLERDDERELTVTQTERVANDIYEDWIAAAAASLEVVRSLEEGDQVEALGNALEDLGIPMSASEGGDGQ